MYTGDARTSRGISSRGAQLPDGGLEGAVSHPVGFRGGNLVTDIIV